MVSRPIIQIPLSVADKIIEVVSVLSVIALWVYTGWGYYSLPDRIPIHYDFAGMPERFGNKSTIFIGPIILTILFIGLTMLARYPHILNYSVKITEDNAYRQYAGAVRLLRYLKVFLVVLIGGITIGQF